MKVYLCEKPSQGRDFAKVLGATQKGDGYLYKGDTYVTWALGHLIQDFEPKDYNEEYKKWSLDFLPLFPDDWKVKSNPNTKKQLTAVGNLLKKMSPNDTVVIATDPEREGELIAVELLEYFKCPAQRMRVWNKSLDEESLKTDIKNAKDADHTIGLYYSALARKRADWLIGMNMTVALTVVNKGKVEGFFPVGRIQTPTLNLVAMRDNEIKNFQSKPYYELNSNFETNDKQAIKANWVPPKDDLEEGKYFTDKNKIIDIKNKIDGKNGIIKDFSKSKKTKSAPKGYSLSGITKVANAKFGYSAQQVLTIMQSLYETHKLCTYPRSDCEYLPNSQHSEASIVLSAIQNTCNDDELNKIINQCDTNKKSPIWNDKKVSAHTAIIPTKSSGNLSKLSKEELNLYTLVKNRYIAQFLPDYEYLSSFISIEIENEIFNVSGNVPVLKGWKIIDGDADSAGLELPEVKIGDTVKCVSCNVEDKKTKPPAFYTEGTLLESMKNVGKFIEDKKLKKLINENEGLGTEATRANIIESLIKRNLLKRDKKNIKTTEKGQALISIAPKLLKDPDTSAYWEQSLGEIEKKNDSYENFLRKQQKVVQRLLDDVNQGNCTLEKTVGYTYQCPTCNQGLKRVTSKKTQKKFWVHAAESNECNLLFPDNRGKPGEPIDTTPIDQGTVDYFCEACNTKLNRKKGPYGIFWSCPNYKNCNSKPLPDNNGKPGERKEKPAIKSDFKCEKCKDGYYIKREFTRNNETKSFWGCSNFPKCKSTKEDDNGVPKGLAKNE